jgi:acyl-coenzyme A synthetase/AMP-(fatty) acid ligase
MPTDPRPWVSAYPPAVDPTLEIVRSLPKTVTGKIQRAALRERGTLARPSAGGTA